MRLSTKDITYCAVFTVLIAVGAFIKIPIPVVPFTLQFFFTNMAGILLGSRLGSLSVIAYTILGLAGLPIFSSGGGIGYVLIPSFGYIIGFIVGTFITGIIIEKAKKHTVPTYIFASAAGLFAVYAIGMIYYYIISNYFIDSPIGVWSLVLYCFLLAVPGDIVLCIFSGMLGKRIRPVLLNMMRTKQNVVRREI